jgi:DNA primase
MPLPADAPAPPTTHPALGRPNQSWPYEDAAGGVIGYVLRFDGADGKEFRPLTLWRDSVSGRLEWRWESWPPNRPLYGLEELADRPVAPVVVCEGEKATDAARRLLPSFVVVTSPNGNKSAEKADWSPLRGRDVVIWPDADLPGDEYAKGVSKCATDAGAKSIAIGSPPNGVDEGWDAADALEEGWTTADAAKFIADAVSWEPKTTTDPLDGLVERAQADAGAPFTSDVLQRLSALKTGDRAAFEALRAELKRAGVRVVALDESIADESEEDSGRGPKQADLLIKLSEAAELFRTRHGLRRH